MSEALSVTLTDEALTGIIPETLPQLRSLVAPLPQTVKLGRVRPKSRPRCMTLGDYVDKLGAVPIPAAVDWYTKAAGALARMYRNDALGCCVFSGKAHNLGIWSANDPDSGPEVQATDSEVQSQYFAYTGGRDSGAVISEVLDYMVQTGYLAGGKRYKLRGYVSCDWRSKELTQIGVALFGAGSIGINLPSAWTSAAVWDTTNTGIVGGHDVSPCGYGAKVINTTADGVVISSWGRLYLITWAAWTSTRWLDELYFMVPEFLWTGTDQKAPSGVDLTTLLADLAKIGGGNLPPLPDPNPVPPVPPVPPIPVPPPAPVPITFPNYDIVLTGDFPTGGLFGGTKTVTLKGSAIQRAAGAFDVGSFTAAPAGFAIPWALVFKLAMQVLPVVLADIKAGKSVQEIIADVLAAIMPAEHARTLAYTFTPDQWLAIAKAIVQFLLMFLGK